VRRCGPPPPDGTKTYVLLPLIGGPAQKAVWCLAAFVWRVFACPGQYRRARERTDPWGFLGTMADVLPATIHSLTKSCVRPCSMPIQIRCRWQVRRAVFAKRRGGEGEKPVQQEEAMVSLPPLATFEATQGQIDLFFSQLPHTCIRIGWHLWEIDLIFAPGLPPGWSTLGDTRLWVGPSKSHLLSA